MRVCVCVCYCVCVFECVCVCVCVCASDETLTLKDHSDHSTRLIASISDTKADSADLCITGSGTSESGLI